MNLFQVLGRRIEAQIAAGGYASVEIFAHENGIPKSTLSEIINGRNDARISTLARIAAGLGLSLGELLLDPTLNAMVREPKPAYFARVEKSKGRK